MKKLLVYGGSRFDRAAGPQIFGLARSAFARPDRPANPAGAAWPKRVSGDCGARLGLSPDRVLAAVPFTNNVAGCVAATCA
jgi:hypothetical protein